MVKARVRGPWGRSGPLLRGTSALSRTLASIWRRSLQLRVVVLTLGLSAVVILVLGFVLTSHAGNKGFAFRRLRRGHVDHQSKMD